MLIPQAYALDAGSVECMFGLFCPTSDASVATKTEGLVGTILGFLTIVAGLSFLIYFMIGALNWITGGDDKTKVDAAKKYMTNGVIGMIAVVASYAIVKIVGTVLGINFLNLGDAIKRITPDTQTSTSQDQVIINPGGGRSVE